MSALPLSFDRRQQREQNARRRAKKADIKRRLTKLARKVLTRRQQSLSKALALKFHHQRWSPASDKRESLFQRLMPVNRVGVSLWDPSFFPRGLSDKDAQNMKLVRRHKGVIDSDESREHKG